MGVNLVTRVRSFSISNQIFTANDHDVQDGCVTPGTHKIMRFDFLSYNAGSSDLVIGSPASRPDLFVWSAGHGHYHLRDFNEFLLFNANGSLATIGYKQAFCAIDIERIGANASPTARFGNCNSNQGISAGWADVYNSGLACQYIVIDNVPNGDYTLQSTTNAKHTVGEDCFGDNTEWTGLRIAGNTVTEIVPPWIPEDRLGFNRANLAVAQFGGRWKVVDGNHWMIDTGASKAEADRIVAIIKHYKLGLMCFVGRPICGSVTPMMYWLTDRGAAPSGSLAGEDCIAFNPSNLAVIEIGGRWKVAEGAHWLLDFGPGHGNAVAALHFIRKYRFNEMCFVGRPGPSMTYFKRRRGILDRVRVMDPRALQAAIDAPHWWQQQRELVATRESVVDFSAHATGDCDDPLGKVGIRLVPTGRQAFSARIVEQHGIRGLALNGKYELELPEPVDQVDILIAHDGRAPTLTARGAGKRVVTVVADDRPRQAELLRLLGHGIERITIDASGGASLVQIAFPGHTRDGSASGASPRASRRKTRARKQS
ncbi:MAG: lysyl oxidase family protein [Gemmatimonadales bacterium]